MYARFEGLRHGTCGLLSDWSCQVHWSRSISIAPASANSDRVAVCTSTATGAQSLSIKSRRSAG
ncbi:hypothetical protein D3C81_972970 [compost metagenome]